MRATRFEHALYAAATWCRVSINNKVGKVEVARDTSPFNKFAKLNYTFRRADPSLSHINHSEFISEPFMINRTCAKIASPRSLKSIRVSPQLRFSPEEKEKKKKKKNKKGERERERKREGKKEKTDRWTVRLIPLKARSMNNASKSKCRCVG